MLNYLYTFFMNLFLSEKEKQKDIVMKILFKELPYSYLNNLSENDKYECFILLAENDKYNLMKYLKYEDNYDVLMRMVRKDGNYLEFGSDRIKNDEDICFEAVQQNRASFQFVSEKFKNDKDLIILHNVDESNYSYPDCISVLNKTRDKSSEPSIPSRGELTNSIVKDGLSLQYVSTIFQDDYNLVYKAVTQNGLALQFASNRLKDNYGIVLAAMKSNQESLNFASDRLRSIF